MRRTLTWLKILAIASIVLFACQAVNNLASSANDTPKILSLPTRILAVTDQPEITTPTLTDPTLNPISREDQEILVKLYEEVNPGVVAIRVLTANGESLGSGFVFDRDGHIVTNYHVVEGTADFEIDFSSGFKARGEVIGTDLDSDLAVLEVDAPPEELHPLKLGDSSQLKVGQAVVAIGNPFGLNGTMTTGIVSGLGRTLESFREAPGGANFTAGDIIQTDAAINPGNSGGPLLNYAGEVIGVNRAIRTLNFTPGEEPINSGIGFAIAINIVKRVVPSLIEKGEYNYPYLGISSYSDLGLFEQEALNLPQTTGAYVNTVTPGGPADKAGLIGGSRATEFPGLLAGGDLIIAIDHRPIKNFSELLSYLINYKIPGDTVILTVLRDGKEIDIELTLEERP